MNNGRFLQPLIERLLLYVGFKQTLAYVSTRPWYHKERKWLIENHAVVSYDIVDQFSEGILIKYMSARVQSLKDLEDLPSTLTYLTFGKRFTRSLDNVTLPPTLMHLTLGHNLIHPLDNVTLPLSLTHLTL